MAPSLLFLCVGNSARSQLAEGLARSLFGKAVKVQSAGSKPAPTVTPFALEVLREKGIDPTGQSPKLVDDIDPASVDTVITLCAEEVCPVFLGQARRVHWPLPDPGAEPGAEEELLARFRATRDEIERRLKAFAGENGIALSRR